MAVIWSLLSCPLLTGAENLTEGIPLQSLHPGDLVTIRVPGHEQLQADVRIPRNGRVAVPQLGTFDNPAGQSLETFANSIIERVRTDWVKDAAVDVSVGNFGPRRSFVMGSVENPGVVDLDPFSEMTVMKAISVVGGFSPEANRSSVHLIRTDLLDPKRKQRIPLPYLDQTESLTTDMALQHGDMIVVDRLDQVYVMGEITRPGAINLPPDGTLTVLKAITMVGGFDRFARKDRVQLLRQGSPVLSVDLKAVLSGKDKAQDPILNPGDIIFVEGSDW